MFKVLATNNLGQHVWINIKHVTQIFATNGETRLKMTDGDVLVVENMSPYDLTELIEKADKNES